MGKAVFLSVKKYHTDFRLEAIFCRVINLLVDCSALAKVCHFELLSFSTLNEPYQNKTLYNIFDFH